MPQFRVTFADALFAWVQVEAPTADDAEWAVYQSYARNCLGPCPTDLSVLDFGEVVAIETVDEEAHG